MNAIPLLLLLTARFNCTLAYVLLPTSTAVVITVFFLTLRYILSSSRKARPGVVCALPCDRRQARILKALRPFVGYETPWWCVDPHWATMLPLLLYKLPKLDLHVQHILGADGAPLTLEWHLPVGEVRGVILTIPGLNGSSKGGYLVDLMQRVGSMGYAVAVMSGRGAGCSRIESVESSFHMGRSSDLLLSLEAVERVGGILPVFVLGYSAGGIRAVTFAGLYGSALTGRVAGVLSFGGCVKNSHTSRFRSSLLAYQPAMLQAYSATMQGKMAHLKQKVSFGPARSFHEFDDLVISRMHNKTLDEYHLEVFGERWCESISVPTLMVNSVDDPVLHVDDGFVPEIAMTNSFVTLLATAEGGHIGWPTGLSAKDHGYQWVSQVSLAFMQAVVKSGVPK